jgi:DNA-binding NarL/FixJ family response regulator
VAPANGAKRITIALGQFGALIDRGLAQTLREDPTSQVVAVNLDIPELEKLSARQAPQVVVLDESAVINPEALTRLRTIQPTIGLVVLAHAPTRGYGARLLSAGGTCLVKDADAEDIITTIHLAAKGTHMLVNLTERAKSRPLTAREEEVFEHLRRSKSYAEVAVALCISVETVRTHARQIRRKLGVVSKADLIGLPKPASSTSRRGGRRR